MSERCWGIEKDTVAARQLEVDPKEWRITMMAIEIDVSIIDDVEVEVTEDEYFDEDYYAGHTEQCPCPATSCS